MSERNRKYAQEAEKNQNERFLALKALLKKDEPFEEVVSLGEKPGEPMTQEEVDSISITDHVKPKKIRKKEHQEED